jgi:hypothetical protein
MNKTIPHQSTFYKRNLFYQYGNYDISFNVYADYDFNVRLYFNNCKFVHIDYIIANCDNSGVSFSNIMHYQERIRILNKYYTNEEIAMNMKEKFNELRARSSKHIKHVK